MKKGMFFLLAFFVALSIFSIAPAIANDFDGGELDTDMTDLLCTALSFLTGGVGKTLAAFACIGVSLAFVGGKVAWTTVLAFSLGMACIFGAPQIVAIFSGGDKPCADYDN